MITSSFSQNDRWKAVYPKLMMASADLGSFIVLMTEEGKGTVVCSGFTNAKKLGDYSVAWNMKYFTQVHGKVEIEG